MEVIIPMPYSLRRAEPLEWRLWSEQGTCYIYILWREEQTTDTVGVASGLGEAFIQQNYKNNVSKGVKVSRINRGSGVLVVLRGLLKEGSVREGRVQVRG